MNRRIVLEVNDRVIEFYAKMYDDSLSTQERLTDKRTPVQKARAMLEGTALVALGDWEKKMGWRESHADPRSVVEARRLQAESNLEVRDGR